IAPRKYSTVTIFLTDRWLLEPIRDLADDRKRLQPAWLARFQGEDPAARDATLPDTHRLPDAIRLQCGQGSGDKIRLQMSARGDAVRCAERESRIRQLGEYCANVVTALFEWLWQLPACDLVAPHEVGKDREPHNTQHPRLSEVQPDAPQ